MFIFIAQALEAETLQGQTAGRIVEAAKVLLHLAGLQPAEILQQLVGEILGFLVFFEYLARCLLSRHILVVDNS